MNQIEPNVQQNAPFDIELISDYFTFPLTMDKLGSIWSANNAIVAHKLPAVSREMMQEIVNCTNDMYFNIIDGIFDTNLKQFDTELYELFTDDMVIWRKYTEIMSVAIHGRYQNYTNSDEIYTNVGKFLTYCCNCVKFDVDLMS